MSDLHVLPEQVFFDVNAGRIRAGEHEIEVHTDCAVVAAKRGEQGYYPIKTRRTAAELNQPDIEQDVLEAMLVGSIFGWDLPIVDQVCTRLRSTLQPIVVYHLESMSSSFDARTPEGAVGLWRRGCYRKVATVYPGRIQQGGLDALEDAWRLTNTIEAPWYAGPQVVMEPPFAEGCRSSSVGDIFEMPDGGRHLVASCGFLEIVLDMGNRESEYLFEVHVDGKRYFTGDESSIGILVNNLSGANFDNQAKPRDAHQGWLDYMVAEYEVPLTYGADIAMWSPEGVAIRRETIGGCLPGNDKSLPY